MAKKKEVALPGTPQLGDRVRDKVTGYTGVLTAKFLYLQGCARCAVQSPVGDDGKIAPYETFDEPQLEILEREVVSVEKSTVIRETGGPAHTRDGGRPEPAS